MHADANHLGESNHGRRKPVMELSAWLVDAGLLMLVISVAAVAVAWGVLLMVT